MDILKIPEGVLGRSIYSLKYEGNKVSNKRLDLYLMKGKRGETNDDR